MENLSNRAHTYFELNEESAILRQEKSRLDTEYEYFHGSIDEIAGSASHFKEIKKINSKNLLYLMDIIEDRAETKKSFGLFFRIKLFFRYGLKLYKTNLDNLGSIIDWLQDSYYVRRKEEIISRLEFISKACLWLGFS